MILLAGSLVAPIGFSVAKTSSQTVLAAPTNLSAAAVSSSQINLAWTGPKGDVIEFSVVPEFGSLATFVLVASVIGIIAIAVKYRLVPRPVSKI